MISRGLGETFTPVTITGLRPGLEWDLAATRSSGCEHQLAVSGTISASGTVRSYSVQPRLRGVNGSGGDSSGSGATYRPRFSSTGWKTVRRDVGNSSGSNSYSASIYAAATSLSSQWSRCGSDEIKVYWFDRTNYQKRHLDITGEQATAIFGLPWWNTIRHMSQSACDSWPTGPVLTGRPPSW